MKLSVLLLLACLLPAIIATELSEPAVELQENLEDLVDKRKYLKYKVKLGHRYPKLKFKLKHGHRYPKLRVKVGK